MDSIELAAVNRARAALDILDPRPRRPRSDSGVLVRALEALIASPHSSPNYDRETGATVARWRSEANVEDADSRSLVIPFAELASIAYVQRDLGTTDGGAGGFLIGVESRIADALRPWSVTAQAGVTIIPNLRSGQVLPTPLTPPTINWANTGGSASTPTLPAAAGEAKVGYGLVNVSRKLRLQTNVEEFLATDLLRVAGRAIDAAVLGGSGADGQPLGVRNWPGVNTMAGASIAFTTISNGKRDATLNGAPSGAWVSTPTVRAVLEQRVEFSATDAAIWRDDRVNSWPAFATPDCPSATLIGGHWPAVYVLLYGAGVVIDLNPFDVTLFRQGIVQFRVSIQLDVLLPIPSSFVVATSVT